MGDKHHPLPWDVRKYDTDQDGYRVDLDKATLEKEPTVTPTEEVRWGDTMIERPR